MQASIIRTIESPCAHPNGLDWYENTLWVVCGDKRAFQLNPANGEVLHSVQTPGHAGVMYDGEYLWVVENPPPAIHKINPETGDTVGTLTPTKPNPIGLAWDGKHIWCGEHHQGICKIDPSRDEILAQLPGQGDRTHDLAWDGECLWFVDTNLGMFYRMDISNGEILASFPSPEDIEPHGLTWDGETLWYTEADGGRNLLHRLNISDTPAL